jgi:hypothetical protein
MLVREAKRRGQAAPDLHRSLGREPTLAVEQLAERGSLDELHHEESLVAVDPGVEHRDHVRVLQPGEDLRLLLKPRDRAGISEVAEQLDRYGSLQYDVRAAPDLGHEAPSEDIPQAVAPVDQSIRLDGGSSSPTAEDLTRRSVAERLLRTVWSGRVTKASRGTSSGRLGHQRSSMPDQLNPAVTVGTTPSGSSLQNRGHDCSGTTSR